jgi:hypothetical protein
MASTTSHDRGAPDPAALTTGLGWFSIGLGTTQLLAPGRVNRLIGVRDDPKSRLAQRFVALQELTAGAAILTRGRPVEWLWGRTAGDVLHLTMLGRAFKGRREDGARLAGAIASVLGCFGIDAYAASRLSSDPATTRKDVPMQGKASITVGDDREEVQRRWRAFVESPDSGSRLGRLAIGNEEPGRLTEWRTTEDARAKAAGVARFVTAPGGRGTEIHVSFEFEVPAGALGEAVLKVIGDDPQQLVRDDLRRFKQIVEAGQISRSDGAPTGSSAKLQPKQRPAQPLEHANA